MSNKPVAVITGAASGLGRDLAHALASRYHLILVDIQKEALDEVANALTQADTQVCDLSDTSDISRLIAAVTARCASIDLLINNAGVTHRSLATSTQLHVIHNLMSVDYLAPVQLTQGLLAHMNAESTVVNIGSMAGWMPVLGRAGYCAAKSALHQYFETLRAELGNSGPHILMVYPGFLDTPIENNALDGAGNKARHKRTMAGRMRSSQWMAAKIVTGIEKKQRRLFPDRFTAAASLLYRVFPSLYLHLMRKKLHRELDPGS
ncbi:SDR family NAD(P)-dependent oxidoreductase [Alteromonas sp. H39]|uniref:SDR family NAD(P)-dependent oxidoreductase n=1 Tax=Alteromonas sp. H39 TaxID=3389876 RepID=UPI0039E0C3DC